MQMDVGMQLYTQFRLALNLHSLFQMHLLQMKMELMMILMDMELELWSMIYGFLIVGEI